MGLTTEGSEIDFLQEKAYWDHLASYPTYTEVLSGGKLASKLSHV